MQNFIFRLDSSTEIGSGHLIRSRNLALEISLQGNQCIFITRDNPGNLNHLIPKEFKLIILPQVAKSKDYSNSNELKGRELYTSWLQCSQKKDVEDTIKALRDNGIKNFNWLIIDHYSLDKEWQKLFQANVLQDEFFELVERPKICVIDDLADRYHNADVLIDPNYYGQQTNKRYQNLIPLNCKTLLGPNYALLGNEYRDLGTNRRTIIQEVNRIFIYFGAGNYNLLIKKIIDIFNNESLQKIRLDIVCRKINILDESFLQLVQQRENTFIYHSLPSLSELMGKADIAIGAGGTNNSERLAVGLFTLVITVADNQVEPVKYLESDGFLQYIGSSEKILSKDIRESFQKLKPDRIKINSIVDGWGVYRVSKLFLGIKLPIILRLASCSDEGILFNWVNESCVRDNSFNSLTISYEEHSRWFKKSLKNPKRVILIAIDSIGCPIGQIRFDFSNDNSANIDISIDSSHRGFGLSSFLINKAIIFVRSIRGEHIQFIANIVRHNIASIRAFEKANFRISNCDSTSNIINMYLPYKP